MRTDERRPPGQAPGDGREATVKPEAMRALQARLRTDSNMIDELYGVIRGCERVLAWLYRAASIEVTISGEAGDEWHGFEQARLTCVSGRGKPDSERALRACKAEAERELEALQRKYK